MSPTLVVDEFHERSVHADLGLALAKQAWLARSDLRILVMSATLDTAPGRGVPRRLPGHRRARDAASDDDRIRAWRERRRTRCARLLAAHDAATCCASCRAREKSRDDDRQLRSASRRARRCRSRRAAWLAGRRRAGCGAVAELPRARRARHHRRDQHRRNLAHRPRCVGGDRHRTSQSRALRRRSRRRFADDRAHHARQRRSARRPRRAARARHRAAAVGRARSAAAASRGGDSSRRSVRRRCCRSSRGARSPDTFEWFDRPAADRIDAAMALLARLGAVEAGQITDARPADATPAAASAAGSRPDRRAADRSKAARHARGCRSRRRSTAPATHIVRSAADHRSMVAHAASPAPGRRAASQQHRGESLGDRVSRSHQRDRIAAGAAGRYPDRVAKRRPQKAQTAQNDDKVTLATGHGAVIGRESGVHDADWLIALDVTSGRTSATTRGDRPPGVAHRTRMADADAQRACPRARSRSGAVKAHRSRLVRRDRCCASIRSRRTTTIRARLLADGVARTRAR